MRVLLLIPEIHLFSLGAAAFLASAAAFVFVARQTSSAPLTPPTPARTRGSLLAGLREVRGRRSLRVGLAVRGACNLAWPALTIGLPFELVRRLHCGLGAYGLLLGVFGAGNLVGNMLSRSPRAGRHLLALPRVCALQRVIVVGASALGVFPVAAGIDAISAPAVIAAAGACSASRAAEQRVPAS